MTRQFQILVSGISLNCLISLKSTIWYNTHTHTYTHTHIFCFYKLWFSKLSLKLTLQPRSQKIYGRIFKPNISYRAISSETEFLNAWVHIMGMFLWNIPCIQNAIFWTRWSVITVHWSNIAVDGTERKKTGLKWTWKIKPMLLEQLMDS